VSPTWYDLLGVERDASTEEIRSAWKAGIADLDPGDRRFRSLNQAAETLLDPQRRAAYDATLPAEEPEEPEEVPEPDQDPSGSQVHLGSRNFSGDPEPEAAADAPAVGGAVTDLRAEKARARAEAREQRRLAKGDPAEPRAGQGVPAWLLGVLAALVLLLAVCAGYLVTQPSDEAIADSTSEAQGAAERAATRILSYDWRTMDEDQAASDALLTPSYRKKFDELFQVLKDNQPTTKTVVTVDQVVASGIVRSGEDRVQVLVFLNRSRTNAQTTEPDQYRDQVVVTMERDGDDWLVDGMDTNSLGG
jgi:Mce-associated membrane protein